MFWVIVELVGSLHWSGSEAISIVSGEGIVISLVGNRVESGTDRLGIDGIVRLVRLVGALENGTEGTTVGGMAEDDRSNSGTVDDRVLHGSGGTWNGCMADDPVVDDCPNGGMADDLVVDDCPNGGMADDLVVDDCPNGGIVDDMVVDCVDDCPNGGI